MSKRQTIDAFFKKKDISHSELRIFVETNANTLMFIELDNFSCSLMYKNMIVRFLVLRNLCIRTLMCIVGKP